VCASIACAEALLPPKPPAEKGVITRTCFGSKPISWAIWSRVGMGLGRCPMHALAIYNLGDSSVGFNRGMRDIALGVGGLIPRSAFVPRLVDVSGVCSVFIGAALATRCAWMLPGSTFVAAAFPNGFYFTHALRRLRVLV